MTEAVFSTNMGDISLHWYDDHIDAYIADRGDFRFTGASLPEPRSLWGDFEGDELISWAVIRSGLAEYFAQNPDQVERLVSTLTREDRGYLSERRRALSTDFREMDEYRAAKSAWAYASIEQEEVELESFSQAIRDYVTPSWATRHLLQRIEKLPSIISEIVVEHREKQFTLYPDVMGSIHVKTGRQRVRTEAGSVTMEGTAHINAEGGISFDHVFWGGLKISDASERIRIDNTCREILTEVVREKLTAEGTLTKILSWKSAEADLLKMSAAIAGADSELTDHTQWNDIATDFGNITLEERRANSFILRGRIPSFTLSITRPSGTRAQVQEFALEAAVTADGLIAISEAIFMLKGNKEVRSNSQIGKQIELVALQALKSHLGMSNDSHFIAS